MDDPIADNKSALAMSVAEALELFASPNTLPAVRRIALTALITAKALPKQADDQAIAEGRAHLLALATTTVPSVDKLLAIAESIRLGQVVKRWMPEIVSQLAPAFKEELPAMQLLTDADDRLNLARACTQVKNAWLPGYLARSIADEETGEKARCEMIAALLASSDTLSDAFSLLVASFEVVRPTTEAPGDSISRRLTRTLVALRGALPDCELDAGTDLGKSMHKLVSAPLSAVGKPQEEKVQIDLSREVLLTVHDVVRSRISLAADTEMYKVVGYCRKLCGGRTWPDELKKPLERLITDVTEAIVLLGRQGQCDQPLLEQLNVLCNDPLRAKFVARDLAKRHQELSEEVREWLELGKVRIVSQASDSAIEAAASTADESIGLALHEARQIRVLGDRLRDPLSSTLAMFDPNLVNSTKDLLDRIRVLAIQIEHMASLRNLDLYGKPGEEIEMSSKFFTAIGNAPRQRMTVKDPAVVRKRADGSTGDVVSKGFVS